MQTGKDNGAAFDEQFAIQLQEGPPGDIEKVVQDFLLLEIAEIADAVADELGLDEETKNRALEITTLYSELEIVAAEIVITKCSFFGKNTPINIENTLNITAEDLKFDEDSKEKAVNLISNYNIKEILAADILVGRLAIIEKSVNSHKGIS